MTLLRRVPSSALCVFLGKPMSAVPCVDNRSPQTVKGLCGVKKKLAKWYLLLPSLLLKLTCGENHVQF